MRYQAIVNKAYADGYAKATTPTAQLITVFPNTFAELLKGRDKSTAQMVPVYHGTMHSSLNALIDGLKFRFSAWRLSEKDVGMIRSCFHDLSSAGTVRNHRATPNLASVGFYEGSTFASRSLAFAVKFPFNPFDFAVNRLFTFALLYATAGLPGDIGWIKSEEVPSNAFLLKDIELRLDGGGVCFRNFKLTIRICYYKGNRCVSVDATFRVEAADKRRNRDDWLHKIIIRPLRQPENVMFCPVTLFVCVMRRRGIILGPMENILSLAAAHPLLHVQLNASPDTPVVLHLNKYSSFNVVDLQVASSDDICSAVGHVAKVGGMAGSIGGHALRRGAARDALKLNDTCD